MIYDLYMFPFDWNQDMCELLHHIRNYRGNFQSIPKLQMNYVSKIAPDGMVSLNIIDTLSLCVTHSLSMGPVSTKNVLPV